MFKPLGEVRERSNAVHPALAGAFTDVVEDAAKRLNLYADGYGITGVCNDSVAVVQQAVTGNASQYPLLMNDDERAEALGALELDEEDLQRINGWLEK
mgnify:CR=1 FL=1